MGTFQESDLSVWHLVSWAKQSPSNLSLLAVSLTDFGSLGKAKSCKWHSYGGLWFRQNIALQENEALDTNGMNIRAP